VSERTPHPDYTAAPEEARWGGTLPALAETLKHEAYAKQGGWAWRVLPGGALVSFCVPPSFRKQFRVVRRLHKPFTEKSVKAWQTEVRTFLDQLGCKDWSCMQGQLFTPAADGHLAKIEALYQEPAPLGGKGAPVGTCARCGKEFELHPTDKVYRELICQPCAIALGQEEASSRG
jgi:hypothetical protein